MDSVQGFRIAMQCSDLTTWLEAHKEYTEQVAITAIENAYTGIPRVLMAGFGLMVSLNAGPVSQECKPLLAPGCHFLANDGHYDAARAQMLAENQQRPPSRARYKMARTADAYLFRFK